MCIFVSSFRRRPAAAVVLCLFLAVVSQAAEKSSSYFAALESIQIDQLKEHVDYLADDTLKGRKAGQAGGRKAADYLRRQLEAFQLQGAGVDGGFFQPFGRNYRNVLARIEGSDPELKQQVIVVGAHYDHVGYGNRYNSRGPTGRIHNGADDNASGASGLLELVEAFTLLGESPKRTIQFAFWDAEEEGMLGSKHWISQPTMPLDRVAAVLNLDMIGRLREDRLWVFGSRSGYGWRRLVSRQNDGLGLSLQFSWSKKEQSDHCPFFERDVPVLMLHTGLHDEYHSPRDKAQLINSPGINRVVRLLFGIAHELANRPETPDFRQSAKRENEATRKQLSAQAPKIAGRLGVSWDPNVSAAEGVQLTRILPGSAAEKANLHVGDRIEQVAAWTVHNGEELTGAVMTAESPATFIVRRAGDAQSQELSVPLDGKRLRLGITWRVDDAEPGTIILTNVVPGSPAARAGLAVGERIYRLDGHDFADDAEFAQLAKTLPGPIELLVERNGQLRTVILHLTLEPLKRAA